MLPRLQYQTLIAKGTWSKIAISIVFTLWVSTSSGDVDGLLKDRVGTENLSHTVPTEMTHLEQGPLASKGPSNVFSKLSKIELLGTIILVLLIMGLIPFYLIRNKFRSFSAQNELLVKDVQQGKKDVCFLLEENERKTELFNEKITRLMDMLDLKRRQLRTLTIVQENVNDKLKTVHENLAGLNHREVEEKQFEISRILHDIKSLIASNNSPEAFQKYFESKHPNFFVKLTKSTKEGLTHNELEHCAYVKMRLTNREVADIQGMSIMQVKSIRNEIKKKLNLGKGKISLSNYLVNLSSK